MQLGIIVPLSERVSEAFQQAVDLDLRSCQLVCWQPGRLTVNVAEQVRAAAAASGMTISALWVGWEGPCTWDLVDGPVTIGLVPEAYRQSRLETLLRGGAFAAALGLADVITHVGFIPENPHDPAYPALIGALRYLLDGLAATGCTFLFETGQETPATLLRTLEDVARPNVGVNLDPANLILYGRGNPVDALDVIGPYVRGVHAKDGCYPTTGRELGRETPLGEGQVDFRQLLSKLNRLGYRGTLTIEREIEGPQQLTDILSARQALLSILEELESVERVG